eukprot:CAMPEP_0196802724 /NCGR_PEP_ID=MMETSP1362-20130617/2296_1 /TAXON_ID=163516 /ORGANISM="Leptocylindrus danicus, Strain CCMP1856" /LENGTH=444 /DNA_ID=CAMNT_0042174101 /DNA_START=6 /DNA_END=1340 /DNA_ORIENTATION=+
MTDRIDPKITDLLAAHRHRPYVSLEFFPPKTDQGKENLKGRLGRYYENVKPLFTDVTWGAGGSTSDTTLDIVLDAHKQGHVANMHLTCTNASLESILAGLKTAYDGGIRNIVALRGDPPKGEEKWTASDGGLTCALDLVKLIREHYKEQFCIAVSGYPEGHPNAITKLADDFDLSSLTEGEKLRLSKNSSGECFVCKDEDYEKEMDYLKQKIEAGGDYIITQMFFDAAVFKKFVSDCRSRGIMCPIVPGIMCISAYPGFIRMTDFCKTRVPADLASKMEAVKDDKEAVKKVGIDFGVELCTNLLNDDLTGAGLHFYTLNLENCTYGILDRIKNRLEVGACETVNTVYGLNGKVLEKRDDDAVALEIQGWTLAGGQRVVAYLNKSSYKKVSGAGETVSTIYGLSGKVLEKRGDEALALELQGWTLAGGQRVVAYLNKASYEKIAC